MRLCPQSGDRQGKGLFLVLGLSFADDLLDLGNDLGRTFDDVGELLDGVGGRLGIRLGNDARAYAPRGDLSSVFRFGGYYE